jgi:hypothetical protein
MGWANKRVSVTDETGEESTTWPGTRAEWLAVSRVVQSYCTCVEPCDADAHEHLLCCAHQLLKDGAALKRLIFFRRYAHALRHSEWMVRRDRAQSEICDPSCDLAD